MATEKEPPVGSTKGRIKELTTREALALSPHLFLTAPILLICLNDLAESLSRPEKPTSNSGK